MANDRVLKTIDACVREVENRKYEAEPSWRDRVGAKSDLCNRFLQMLRNIKDVYEETNKE